ncbi:aminodeoxychorismate lyase [Bacillus sp. FJAT-45037]|uniref:aminodeoxychorismate lyase n=1 Tax=Bacillus sp. FJAT-45037 TaxID=2011007 RepID=UPI000C24C897|nr:aminodeoxychorismate lyase [Bacillus sp. FJAT-45037]
MIMYVNGAFVTEKEAKVSAFDHGYMYGLGLFETFRVYHGHPFLLDDHFQRLQQGLKMLNIEWTMTKEDMHQVIVQLIQDNHLQKQDAYIRWNVSAGDEGIGLYTGVYRQPTTIAYIKPLPPKMSTEKRCVLLKTRRNAPETWPRLKSHHYLNNVIAKREIGTDPTVEGIFLTDDEYLAEGVVSNLFWVKEGVVYTPTVKTGILDGITRQLVIALLLREGFEVKEGFYRDENLLTADEAFMTNSIQEVVELTSINEVRIEGAPLVCQRLQELYKQLCRTLWTKNDV